jgi:hypothetical protein
LVEAENVAVEWKDLIESSHRDADVGDAGASSRSRCRCRHRSPVWVYQR